MSHDGCKTWTKHIFVQWWFMIHLLGSIRKITYPTSNITHLETQPKLIISSTIKALHPGSVQVPSLTGTIELVGDICRDPLAVKCREYSWRFAGGWATWSLSTWPPLQVKLSLVRQIHWIEGRCAVVDPRQGVDVEIRGPSIGGDSGSSFG